MKARIPKAWQALPKEQKKAIQDYAVQVAVEEAKKMEEGVCRDALEQYIKVACLVLHDVFGFGEKRLTCFLGTHLRYFKQHNRLLLKGEKERYIEERLKTIFHKDGFPQHFIDGLVAPVALIDDPMEGKQQKEE